MIRKFQPFSNRIINHVFINNYKVVLPSQDMFKRFRHGITHFMFFFFFKRRETESRPTVPAHQLCEFIYFYFFKLYICYRCDIDAPFVR